MLLLSHVAVGTAIASSIGNPWIAVMLSFVSHYALDCVPHTDFSFTKNKAIQKFIIVLDIIFTILAIIFFINKLPDFINQKHLDNIAFLNANNLPISLAQYPFELDLTQIDFGGIIYNFSPVVLLCLLASILPNILMIPVVIFKKNWFFLKWNVWLKNTFHFLDNKIMGIIVQPATILVFSLYAFRLLPNSESDTFLVIIGAMLSLVSILAVLELFTDDKDIEEAFNNVK